MTAASRTVRLRSLRLKTSLWFVDVQRLRKGSSSPCRLRACKPSTLYGLHSVIHFVRIVSGRRQEFKKRHGRFSPGRRVADGG